MLQNLFHILVLSLICISWGLPVVLFQQKRAGGFHQINTESIILSFFAGLVVIALLSSWLSLFMPLNYMIIVVLMVVLTIAELLWLNKLMSKKLLRINPILKKPGLPGIFLVSALLLFIFLGSSYPVMDDTDLYHIQIIRWNQQYDTVPGIANLYLRFGFFSNWFHLISIFSFPFGDQNFLFLNIAVSGWFLFFLVHKLQFHLSDHSNKTHRILSLFYFLVIVFMLAEWDLMRGAASSTSYDFIVTVLFLLVLSLITENVLLKNDLKKHLPVITIFSVAAPFFKISGFPLLLILLGCYIICRQSLRNYFLAAGIFLLFLIPCLAKNYTQTGYFLFPYTTLSGEAKPDWQVPKELVTRFTDYISLGNKYINQSIPAKAWEHPRQFSLEWIPIWMRSLTLPDKIISSLVVLSFILSFFITSFKQKENAKLRIIYYAVILLLPLWFFSAPDPRFAYGPLIFAAFLPISFLAGGLMKKIFIQAGLLTLTIAMLVYVSSKTKQFETKYLIHPPSILIPPYEKINYNGFTFHLPGTVMGNWNIRCYDTPLPCICQLNPYLEPRGKELPDGFRMKPINDSSFILNYNY